MGNRSRYSDNFSEKCKGSIMIYNKWIIGFICGVFAVLWKGLDVPFWTAVGYTSLGVWTVWAIFNYAVWRIWPSLFGRKIISGKWKGKIKSSFKGSTTKDVEVKIIQTFSNTTIKIKTNEIVSKSVVVGWDKKDNILYYIYKTDPIIKFKDKNPVQDGAAKIVFDKQTHKNKLIIEYWTDRETTGYIELKKVSYFGFLKTMIKNLSKSKH